MIMNVWFKPYNVMQDKYERLRVYSSKYEFVMMEGLHQYYTHENELFYDHVLWEWIGSCVLSFHVLSFMIYDKCFMRF